MKIIKTERLLLALAITLVIADTIPHPNLSTGLVEHSLRWMQAELRQADTTKAEIAAGVNR